MLAVAHALESHKTLSGEDVTAVFEGGRGPVVDGAPYADDAFVERLRDYHVAAARAHREHNQPELPLPVPTPAYAIGYPGTDQYGTNGNGTGSYLDGTPFGGTGTGRETRPGPGRATELTTGPEGTGNGTGNGTGGDDVIEFGG